MGVNRSECAMKHPVGSRYDRFLNGRDVQGSVDHRVPDIEGKLGD